MNRPGLVTDEFNHLESQSPSPGIGQGQACGCDLVHRRSPLTRRADGAAIRVSMTVLQKDAESGGEDGR